MTTPGRIGNNYQTTVNMLRLIDKRLISSNIEIYFEFDLNDEYDNEAQAAAVMRMKKWMETVVDGCLAFNTSSSVPLATMEKIDNHMMFCPEEPYDYILTMLMHSKLDAIGKGVASVTRFSMVSDMGNGFGNWSEGDVSQLLPSLSEWVGERSYYSQPWWSRPDGSMIDMWAGPDDDVTIKPNILIDLDAGDEQHISTEPAEIIKPNFTPTIISDD